MTESTSVELDISFSFRDISATLLINGITIKSYFKHAFYKWQVDDATIYKLVLSMLFKKEIGLASIEKVQIINEYVDSSWGKLKLKVDLTTKDMDGILLSLKEDLKLIKPIEELQSIFIEDIKTFIENKVVFTYNTKSNGGPDTPSQFGDGYVSYLTKENTIGIFKHKCKEYGYNVPMEYILNTI